MNEKCWCDHTKKEHDRVVETEQGFVLSDTACKVYGCICQLFEKAKNLVRQPQNAVTSAKLPF